MTPALWCRGGGGSYPLVPTKTPLRTCLYGWFFYACLLHGETLGNYWGETPPKLEFVWQDSNCVVDDEKTGSGDINRPRNYTAMHIGYALSLASG